MLSVRTLLQLGLLAGTLVACDGDQATPTSPAVVTLSPQRASLTVGASQTLNVQITNGGRALPTLSSCASNRTDVATAARSGIDCIVTGVAAGSASITATTTTGESATAEITVQPAVPALTGLFVAPFASTLVVGDSATIDARAQAANGTVTVTYAYQSQSPTVATVSSTGVVRAVSAGTAVIQATAVGRGAGVTESTLSQSIAVTVRTRTAGLTDFAVSLAAGPATLLAGESRRILVTPVGPLAATATYAVTSSAPDVAIANANLMVTAVSSGTATLNVTASVPQAGEFSAASLTRQITVNVLSPAPFSGFTVTPASTQPLLVGGRVQLNANYTTANGASATVAYASNAPGVATVAANGVVTAVGPGSAVITTTLSGSGSGFATLSESRTTTVTVLDRTPGLFSLSVSPLSAERYVGQSVLLEAAVNGPSVALVTKTYTSDRPSVATVRSDGVVTAVGPGTATISVSASVPQNGAFAAATLSSAATVTVRTGVRSIALGQSALSVPIGQSRAITALVSADAGISTGVQYISRNPSVASVASNGIVTALAGGTAIVLVRAAADTTVADSVTVTIVNSCATPRTVSLGQFVVGRLDSFSCQGDRQLFRYVTSAQTEVRFAFSQADAPVQLAPIVGPLGSGAWEIANVVANSEAYALVPAGTWTFAVRSATNPINFTLGVLTPNAPNCADYVTAFGITLYPMQLSASCLRAGGYHSRRFRFAPRLAANDLLSLRMRAPGFPIRIDLFDESGALLATSTANAAEADALLTYRSDVARTVWAEVSNRAQPGALGQIFVSFAGPRVEGVRIP